MQVYRCIELCIRCFFYQLNCFRDGVAFCFIYFFIDLPVLFSSSLRLFMLLGLGFSRTCYFFFFLGNYFTTNDLYALASLKTEASNLCLFFFQLFSSLFFFIDLFSAFFLKRSS